MKALWILPTIILLGGCAQYKALKDSFCSSTTLCEVVKEVKDAAKDAAVEAVKDTVKDAVSK